VFSIVFPCVAVSCSVLQCLATNCSVLKYVAVCYAKCQNTPFNSLNTHGIQKAVHEKLSFKKTERNGGGLHGRCIERGNREQHTQERKLRATHTNASLRHVSFCVSARVCVCGWVWMCEKNRKRTSVKKREREGSKREKEEERARA